MKNSYKNIMNKYILSIMINLDPANNEQKNLINKPMNQYSYLFVMSFIY